MAGWPKPFRRAYTLNPIDPIFLGGGPRGDLILSDVDDDGRRDIVAVIGPALFVIGADGELLPGWPQTWPLIWPCVAYQDCMESLPAVGDVDGDGKKEIAVVVHGTKASLENAAQSLLLYRHDGTLMPGFPRTLTKLHYGPPVATTAYTNTPILADFDGDGDLEIVAPTSTTKVGAYHHTGRPLGLKPRKAAGTDNRACLVRIPPMLEPPTAGDLDGDGKAELVIGTHAKPWFWRPSGRGTSSSHCLGQVAGPDYITVMRAGRGAALPGWPAALPYPGGDHSYGPGPAAIGDIDGDLRPEVVSGAGICGRFDQPLRFEDHVCFPIHAFDTAGQLLPGFPKAAPYPGSTNGVTPAIGDLDGDGLKEIVWIDFGGQIVVWNVPGIPAPEAMQWPMFRHDPGHTGALVADP